MLQSGQIFTLEMDRLMSDLPLSGRTLTPSAHVLRAHQRRRASLILASRPQDGAQPRRGHLVEKTLQKTEKKFLRAESQLAIMLVCVDSNSKLA